MADEYYTVKEVAEMFKVKDQTVRKWIKNGKLKPTYLDTGEKSHTLRIEHSEIERFKKEE